MKRGAAGWASALALFVALLFAHTVRARAPWFGKPSDGHMYWLTAHSVKALENWWEEGARASGFLLLENPRSVEHRTRSDRMPYTSYPPGAFVPPHLVARLTGIRPSPAFVMAYDLANHFAIAALLAALGFAAARAAGLGGGPAALFGALPAAVVLLAPGPLYWLQNVYFADQAVILPFVLALALEWARSGGGRAARLAAGLSPVVVLWGCLVEYLFVFVTAALFVGRWVTGEHALRPAARLRAALVFCVPPAAALALFGLHLRAGGGLDQIVGRARWRMTGPNGRLDGAEAAAESILGHARAQYGATGVALLAAGAAALLLLAWARARTPRDAPGRAVAGRLLGLGALALAPPLAHLAVLRSHSANHDFSVLKLAVPLALIPLVVVPLAALALAGPAPSGRGRERAATLAAAAACAVFLAWLAAAHPGWRAQFPRPWVSNAGPAQLLREESRYADIVFSPDYAIDLLPPHLLAISRERVYRVADPDDLARRAREMTAALEEPFRICLLFTRPMTEPWRPLVRGLRPARRANARLFCGVRPEAPAPGAAAPPR